MINEGDSRLHYGMNADVLAHRARHEALLMETIRLGTRSINARVVVVPTRRVVAELEEQGLWGAYKAIYRVLKSQYAEVGVRAFDPSRVGGGISESDDLSDLVKTYGIWVEMCKRKHKSPLMVRNMIVDGWNFAEIEAKYKFMHGTAKKNLFECLALWSEA